MAFVKVDTHLRRDLSVLGPKTTLVYLHLGLCVNGDGDAWPSQRKIAQETGLTRGEVQGALSRLSSMGYITVHLHRDDKRQHNSYTVNHHFHFGRHPHPDQLPLHLPAVPRPICNPAIAPQITVPISPLRLDSPADSAAPAPPAVTRTMEPEPDTTYLGAERPTIPETPTELRVLPTPEVRREYVAAAESKPRALYSALVTLFTLFPGGSFPAPGGGARCPAIGRLGVMEKAHGWGRVLEEMEHARIDQAVGKVAQGDILSWIERRLQGDRARTYRGRSGKIMSATDIGIPVEYNQSDWDTAVRVGEMD